MRPEVMGSGVVRGVGRSRTPYSPSAPPRSTPATASATSPPPTWSTPFRNDVIMIDELDFAPFDDSAGPGRGAIRGANWSRLWWL